MKILKCFFFVAAVTLLALSGSVLAESNSGKASDTIAFSHDSGTAKHRAAFAHFLSTDPDPVGDPAISINTAISISNVCVAPAEVEGLGLLGTRNESGGVMLFLWRQDGTMIMFDTTTDVDGGGGLVGAGLRDGGVLNPGDTWTVLLSEILDAKGEDGSFNGFGWALSTFDCLAGTYNVTVFGVNFTQAFEFMPAMGQGGVFGGIALD